MRERRGKCAVCEAWRSVAGALGCSGGEWLRAFIVTLPSRGICTERFSHLIVQQGGLATNVHREVASMPRVGETGTHLQEGGVYE